MPACAEINNSMQQFTDVKYSTVEQYKDATCSRDSKNTQEVLHYLSQISPFTAEVSLRNIANGVTAPLSVNVHKSKGRFTLTRTVRVVRSVKCNSREQLANQADFRRIFYLLIPASRKLYLKSMQYAAQGLNNVLFWIFAISLCIPSQIDARHPATF